MQDHMETPKDHLGTIGIKINRKDKLKHSWKTFFMGNMTWNYVKETFCKKIKRNLEFDHIFWFPSIVWKNFKITECAHRLHQNKTTERRQIQLVLAYQKYWSNSIFHFIFLQKVSFKI